MDVERRGATRIKTHLVARYSCGDVKDEDKKWDETLIKDVSEGGICITTNPFAAGTILTFLITIPFEPFRPIKVNGRVVESVKLTQATSDESVAGTNITRVQFIDLKGEQRALLKKYIEWFIKKEGGKR